MHTVLICLSLGGGQPEPSSRARPDSIRTGGPNGGCGTHKAAENRQRHGEEVRSPPNQPLGGAGWAGRTAEPSGYGLQVRLAVSLPHPVAVTGIGDDLTGKRLGRLFSRAEVSEAQVPVCVALLFKLAPSLARGNNRATYRASRLPGNR